MARAVEPLRGSMKFWSQCSAIYSASAPSRHADLEKMHNHLSKANIDERRIKDLEHAIDECEKELEPLKPSSFRRKRKGAVLHVARTVCRRARAGRKLQREVEIPPSWLST